MPLALASGAIVLLFNSYRPILVFQYGEPIGWLAFAIVLPIAISAVLAYTPALRHNSRKAAAVCLGIALADVALSLVLSPQPTIDQMSFSVVAGFVPVLALLAVSRLAISKRVPWTLLVIGPLAYWVTALCAVFVWAIALYNTN